MEEYRQLIQALSDVAGIIPEYYDIFGKKHVTSHESRVAILSAMDLQVGTPDQVRREIEKKRAAYWQSVLDPAIVISVHAQPHRLAVRLPLDAGREHRMAIAVTVEDEHGRRETFDFPAGTLQTEQEQVIDGRRFIRTLLELPGREIGYYSVSVACSHPDGLFEGGTCSLARSARLIITPDACYMPEQLLSGRTWGVALNLYALQSEQNWGAGDFNDLRKAIGWLAGLGAGLVGINPLHAIPNTKPFGISPYSPVSRLYRNLIYIDMERVPELAGIAIPAPLSERIASLRKNERIDYEAVAALKRELLEQAYDLFFRDHYLTESPRGNAFRGYVQAEGDPLRKFSIFCALSEYMRRERRAAAWPDWPGEYRSPGNPAVEAFRKDNEKNVVFFEYIQWLIDTQMNEVSGAAAAAGLHVGLYGDLAIGAVDSGSDGWMYQDVLAEQATVGAPPDDFNANGQDWGFPPMIPDALRQSGYDLFIRTIRKNMQHLGALRIDHALGLFRLFWIPVGRHPGEGAYVRCDAEDLLRIIALESVRNRTLVVGEDLGTITDEARRMLQQFGILSYRLFYFERNYPDPSFLPPERYPAMALSAVTTHDLPTLYGYWQGRDLAVKRALRIIGDEAQYDQQKRGRERDRALILQALRHHGFLPDGMAGDNSPVPVMTPDLCAAIYRYLAASPAKLVLVSLDDVIGTVDQQNMPGTVSEYPNWMQKTPLSLDEIIADSRWQPLAAMFRNTRAIGREKTEAKAV